MTTPTQKAALDALDRLDDATKHMSNIHPLNIDTLRAFILAHSDAAPQSIEEEYLYLPQNIPPSDKERAQALEEMPSRYGAEERGFDKFPIHWFDKHYETIRAALSTPQQAAPDGWNSLIADSIQEANKAIIKFPQPNYVISKIAEEAGEVVKAAIHCAENRETHENLRGEMKQLIAMLYRLWKEGDQVHGLSPLSAAPDAQKGAE